MRRRLSWAVLGTSGVLAAIVAATIVNQPDTPSATKIIVPQTGGVTAEEVPDPDKTKPSTVFIPDVPQVAVTSETVIPEPVAAPTAEAEAPPKPAVTQPKPNPNTATAVRRPAVQPPRVIITPTRDARSAYGDYGSSYWEYRYRTSRDYGGDYRYGGGSYGGSYRDGGYGGRSGGYGGGGYGGGR